MFIHHVYFWLRNESNEEDKAKLIEGLKKLSKATTIKKFYIGVPAATNRDVIERSYSISWLVFFDNPADQDSYQTDPIHLKFVEECSMLWKKVVVYDSIDVQEATKDRTFYLPHKRHKRYRGAKWTAKSNYVSI